MAVSESVASSLRGNPRTLGLTFADPESAATCKRDMLAAGHRNVRVSKFCDFTYRNGNKVFAYTVRCDA